MDGIDKAYLREKIQIFKGANLESAVEKCLDKKFTPLNVDSIKLLRHYGMVPCDESYDTSTVNINGLTRDARFEELLNIKSFYKKGGYIFFVHPSNDEKYARRSVLGSNACFVGVPSENMDYIMKIVEKYNK